MSPDLYSLSLYAAPVLYLLASLGLWRAAAAAWPTAVAAAAIGLHALGLHSSLMSDGALYLGLTNSLSLFAWQCALLVAIFGLALPLRHLGLVVYPLAGVCAALLCLSFEVPDAAFKGGWSLGSHVLLSLLAYGLLTIAAVQALFLLAQDRGLRQHPMPASISSLPPLETMEQLLFQLMGLGFFLLSLALLSGLLFVEDIFAQHLVHKTFFSALAWLVFAILLWGRWQFGWRGRKAINWSLGGYASLLLAYFGSKWVLEALLGTSWG